MGVSYKEYLDDDQIELLKSPKKVFFLGQDFPGKKELVWQLLANKYRFYDKDWSKYDYWNTHTNEEAIKYVEEIRLTLAVKRVPVLVWLDVSTLPPDLMEHLHDGTILSIQMSRTSDIHDLIDRYVTRVNGALGHTRHRGRWNIEKLRLRL